jgi:hypothetical protein
LTNENSDTFRLHFLHHLRAKLSTTAAGATDCLAVIDHLANLAEAPDHQQEA